MPSRPFFNRAQKIAIFIADQGICYLCGKKLTWEDYEPDHVESVKNGGSNDVLNGRASCVNCNKRKGAMSYEAFTALQNNPKSQKA